MAESTLVRDLAVVMVVSGAVTAIFHRLRQPVVLGYILAGVIIGPHTPPFALIRDPHSIETLAELGVILLLFSIGLELSLRKLRRVGGVALLAAGLEIAVMTWLGFSAGRMAGWSTMDSVFLGAILSVSSTTIIAKAFMELGLTREPFARIVMGILIVEDLGAIVMLVVLSALARAGEVAASQALLALAGVGLFVTTLTVVGLVAVPRLLNAVVRIPAREVLTVTVLGLCFGAAILAGELGFSVALGAFLAGAVMAESRHVHLVEQRIESVREMFSAIFFVAVGLLIDPAVIVDNCVLVLSLAALTVTGKAITCSAATFLAGYPPRTALRVGMALGQIGEFSFIIADLGRQAGVVSPALYPLTVAVSAVTTLTTPYQIRSADAVVSSLASWMPARLLAFSSFYERRMRATGRRKRLLSPDASRGVAQGLVCAALLVALLLVNQRLLLLVRAGRTRAILFPHDLEVLVWSVCGVLGIPILIGAWRAGGLLATSVVGPLASGSTRRLLVETLRFAFCVVGGAVFLAVGSPILPSGLPMVVTASIVAVAAIVFWRSVSDAHARAEEILSGVFSDAETPTQPATQSELVKLVSTKYPFEVVLEDFILPFHDTAANGTIRDLALRKRTGATIAVVYREEKPIVNPDPDVRLLPGDLVVLLGSADQVQAAIRELEGLAGKEPV
ncbi:MAG: monovalent cation:H+ antiporter-2, family [Candidatus Binatota bacterium]|nr:monovalent cation:H+ antiporter-2, family [Candidatus Binatota bacterium]